MGRKGHTWLLIVVILTIAGVIACGGDPPPAPAPQVVKKKIAQQTTPEKAAIPAAGQKLDTPAKGEQTSPPSETPSKGEDAEQTDEEASGLVQASREMASEYDPEGRFDPFEPLFKEETSDQQPIRKGKLKKRVPQTPLERVAIGQLKLSAIMRMTSGNRAIVEDATGKGYVIKKGTYVGLNSGQVTRIENDRVLIEEEIENVMGELIIQNTELKLQKPAGEL